MLALYIILGVLLFIVLLITVILCIPIKILITYTESEGLDYKIKILFYTLKSDPKKHTFIDIIKQLKDIQDMDLSQLNNNKTKPSSVSKHGVLSTVKEVFGLLKFVLSYLKSLLGSFKITKLYLDIVCADEDDTSEAATNYGKICAVVYPSLGFINSYFNVKTKKERINIGCDYLAEKSSFSLDTVLSIRISHILVALIPTLKKMLQRAVLNAKQSQNSIEKRG